MGCEIIEVKAANGKPSKLYHSLLTQFKYADMALPLYLNYLENSDYTNVDENGEPLLDSIQIEPISQTAYAFMPELTYIPKAEDIIDTPINSVLQSLKIQAKKARSLNDFETAKNLALLANDIKNRKDLKNTVKYFGNRISELYNILTTNPNVDESVLLEIKDLVDFIDSAFEADVFTEANTKLTKLELDSLLENSRLLKIRYKVVATNKVKQRIKEEIDTEHLSEFFDKNGNFKPIKNTNLFTAKFLDATKSSSVINQIAILLGLRSSDEARQEVTDKLAYLDELKQNLLEDMTEEEIDQYVKKYNADGKFTGRLVTKYDDAIVRAREELLELVKVKRPTAKNLFSYANFIINSMYIDTTSTEAINKKAAYDKFIKDASLLYSQKELESFIARNSIDVFISALQSYQKAKTSGDKLKYAKIIANHNFSYTSTTYADMHIDPKWQAIQAIPKLAAYYNYYQTLTEENRIKLAGESKALFKVGSANDVNSLFQIPALLSDKISRLGIGSIAKGSIADALIDSIFTKTQGGQSWVDPITNKRVYSFYKPMQKRLSTNIDVRTGEDYTEEFDNTLSHNLTHAITAHTLIANKLERNRELAPAYEIMHDVQKMQKIIHGKNIYVDESAAVHEQMEYLMNHKLYGKVTTDDYLSSGYALLTSAEKEEYNSLTRELEHLKNEPPTIENQTKISNIEEAIFRLGTKRLSLATGLDTINEWCRRVGLSGNIIASITDVIYGFVSAAIEANYGIRKTMRAYYEALSSPRSSSKLSILAKKFNLEGRGIEQLYSNQNIGTGIIDKYVNQDAYYLTQQYSASINSKAVLYLYFTNTKAPDSDKSLWDSFNEAGEWAEGTDPFKSEFIIGQDYESNRNLSNISIRLNSEYQRINGNFNPETPMAIKKDVWGRLLMTFKSFLPNQIDNRFSAKRFDTISQEFVEGRYLEYWKKGKFVFDKNGKFDKTRMFNNFLQVLSLSENGELTEHSVKAMRNNLRELSFVLLSMTVGFVLRSIALDPEDEDDKEEYTMLNYMINQNNRVLRDLTFYYWPPNTIDALKNPVPAVGVVVGAFRAIDATTTWAFGKDGIGFTDQYDIYQRGPYKGQSKAIKRIKAITPYARAYEAQLNNLRQILKERP
jgi:hypothetical protein